MKRTAKLAVLAFATVAGGAATSTP